MVVVVVVGAGFLGTTVVVVVGPPCTVVVVGSCSVGVGEGGSAASTGRTRASIRATAVMVSAARARSLVRALTVVSFPERGRRTAVGRGGRRGDRRVEPP